MNWIEQAKCRDQTDLFFNEKTYLDAIAICKTCPSIRECKIEAEKYEDLVGVFGGKIYKIRTGRPRNEVYCGTEQGYMRHISSKTIPCKECKLAHSKHQTLLKDKYYKNKIAKQACGTFAGISKHKKANEEPCEKCLEFRRKYKRNSMKRQRKEQKINSKKEIRKELYG